jgi:U32 family peptidase
VRAIVPVVTTDEISELNSIPGIDYYCGIVPFDYYNRMSVYNPLNSRDSLSRDNFRSIPALVSAIELAARAKKRVSIAFNEKMYGSEQIDYALSLITELRQAASFDVIVGSIPLILAIQSQFPEQGITTSTESPIYGVEDARFFWELGITSLTLPRDISISEIREICGSFPGVRVKTFVLNEGCFFSDGHCHTFHLPHTPPLCRSVTLDLRRKRNDVASDTDTRGSFGRESPLPSLSDDFGSVPVSKCGLCAVKDLMDAGVSSVKVVGRYVTGRKVHWARAVAEAISQAGRRTSTEFRYWVKSRLVSRDSAEACSNGVACYYANPMVVGETPDLRRNPGDTAV